MLAELKDGHVNLYSSSNMARYWDWYLDYPRNFNEGIIERQYLGKSYRIAGGLKYKILEDNIGISITNHSPMVSATVIWTKHSPTLLHVAD